MQFCTWHFFRPCRIAIRQGVGYLCLALLSGVSSALAGSPHIDYPSLWICDESRFHWYCDREPENPDYVVRNHIKPEAQALEELDRLRKSLEAKRALALMQPTPDHLRDYIAAQEAMMDRASVFSDVWRRVVWTNPELNYQLRNPVNNAAVQLRDVERSQREKRTLQELAQEWGLFFVFRSDCPFCHRLSPTLKLLADTYGITVFPVSLDGGALPEFPSPQRDNGLARMLDVKQVPFVALGNVKDRRVVPLGSGVLSLQEMVERIYVLTQTQPGELY